MHNNAPKSVTQLTEEFQGRLLDQGWQDYPAAASANEFFAATLETTYLAQALWGSRVADELWSAAREEARLHSNGFTDHLQVEIEYQVFADLLNMVAEEFLGSEPS